jgi:hypothetical protein
MTAVADKTQDLAASPTRREVVWTVAAALAGLGVVVNAAAPRAAVSPVIAAAMSISWVETWAVLVAVAATITGLVLLGWWPWLLLVGALLTLPAATPTLGCGPRAPRRRMPGWLGRRWPCWRSWPRRRSCWRRSSGW